MAFNFLAALILLAVSTGVNLLLRPRIKRARAPDLETPKADEGVPIPLGYGTFVVAPNWVYVGDVDQVHFTNGTTGYIANLVGTLCLGPINELVDIQLGGKSLRFEPVTQRQGGSVGNEQVITPSLPYVRTGDADTPTEFVIHARDMFGGSLQEGGIQGTLRIYWGGLNQPADALTTAYMQAAELSGGTGRPGVCYCVFARLDAVAYPTSGPATYWGTVPRPPDITFTFKHSPEALGVGMTGRDANPAEIIYDLLVNNLRGLGLSPSLVDFDNFVEVAETLSEEGTGLSPVFSAQDEVEDMIDDILKHIVGVMRISPLTGKYQLKLARNDYAISELPRITTALRGASYGNAKNLELSRPSYRETTNDIQITYRRFIGGPTGPQTNKVLTTNLNYPDDLRATFDVGAHNITLVTLYGDGVVIPPTIYTLLPQDGIVILFNGTGAPAEGATVTIDYTAGPVASGYKESTARWQDLASIQQSGELRSFTADYPFFTSDLVAGTHVARLGQQMSRSLWRAKWEMDRSGYGLAPGDVVRISHTPLDADGNEFEILDDLPFRVTEVDYGLLEDGTITVHAVEDVFGQDVVAILPPPTSGTNPAAVPAPSIAISYAATSATRICLYSTDQNFAIRLWRASSDLGLGITTGADVITTLPGTTTFYDDTRPVAERNSTLTAGRPFEERWTPSTWSGDAPQYSNQRADRRRVQASQLVMPAGDSVVLGETSWYAAQLVALTQIGFAGGALTPWQSMTATAGTPGACTCTIPTLSIATSDVADVGTLTLTITDSQNRVSLVEFQTRAGYGPLSDWTTDTSPYVATVSTLGADPSTISYRVTYLDCAGVSVSNLTGTVTFP